jgi:hypothetical protein
MEAAEAVIRAGMLKLGGGMLARLLAADPGYRGPRVPCGQGHEAEFVSYREKVIDTVLGPVTISRAWYHCAACGHGLAPRDARLGVAGASLSPGLAAMNDRAAAAAPFATAAGLLEDLAGVRLGVKRVERAAEASGAAQAGAVRERSGLITSRKVVPLPPVIALWMGHESTRTTMIYLKADLELKQRALDRTAPVDGQAGRYRPPDDIIDFLDSL